ncbi:MAG: bifunctional DNA primase/polymerase [Chloroflexota bacterium]
MAMHDRGWSLIPLHGAARPEVAKTPALPTWKPYQTRRADIQQLDQWFVQAGHTAAGVVLGHISGVIVIDLDDPNTAQAFATALPHLTDTFTVQSGKRQLPHYYYAISSDMYIPRRFGRGIELRADGQYVVAPGTRIGDHCWSIVRDVEPRKLTQGDLRRLLAFIQSLTPGNVVNTLKSASGAKSSHSFVGSQAVCAQDEASPELTATSLRNWYRQLAVEQGRNNALFAAACFARDRGWSSTQVDHVLRPAHINQPAALPGAARSETPQTRAAEAARTIASAFSRPPARSISACATDQNDQASRGLPNRLREVLIQRDLVNAARLLDGLLLAGVRPGAHLTAAAAYALVGPYGIGRNQVFAVFKTMLDDGRLLFDTVSQSDVQAQTPSPRTPHPPDANAASGSAGKTKQCLFGRVAEPVKTMKQAGGRPARVIILPGIDALCERLNLPPLRADHRYSDRLRPDALRSPAAYRAALHAALVKRAPGRYTRRWQARRLGVSRATCRRYDRRGGLAVQPYYHLRRVTWHTLRTLLDDEPQPGRFLQDEQGRRYPALATVARMMLARGRRLMLLVQGANHYAAGPVPTAALRHTAADAASAITATRTVSGRGEVPAWSARAVVNHDRFTVEQGEKAADDVPPPVPRIDPWQPEVRRFRRDSNLAPIAPDDSVSHDPATAAEALYAALRRRNPARALTRSAAVALVERCGPALIMRGLRVVEGRDNLRNPAGFLLVWLRGELAGKGVSACAENQIVLTQNNSHRRKVTRAAEPSRDLGTAAVEHDSDMPIAVEPGGDDWLDRMRRSPYAHCIANAEDLAAV